MHFSQLVPGLGLIMYILTTLEFPKHNHDFHLYICYLCLLLYNYYKPKSHIWNFVPLAFQAALPSQYYNSRLEYRIPIHFTFCIFHVIRLYAVIRVCNNYHQQCNIFTINFASLYPRNYQTKMLCFW